MTADIDVTPRPVSLRERRRAELRQHLSDTATALFLQHGFDTVTVADVARACGVTEKTVFNHFSSKEALLVDRWPELIASVRANLADQSHSLLDAVLATLTSELEILTEGGKASAQHMAGVTRFGALLESSPALLDHRRRYLQQLTAVIRTALVERFGTHEDDPATQITAEALAGLFPVFYRSLARHAPRHNAAQTRRRVRADIQQAARRLAEGLTD